MIVAFPPRTPQPKDRRFKVTLVKDGRKRLYQILPGGSPEQWQVWIRADGKELHAVWTHDAAHLDRIRREWEEDIAALKASGWSEMV